jgi:hypothetical protein
MPTDDLEKIADPKDLSWIKVRRYCRDDSKSAQDQLVELEQHHLKETTFLLNKCRELAKELLNQSGRKE